METQERRSRDIPAILLLFAAIWVAALRLWITDWTKHLDRIELLVVFGFILGLMLGRSIFSSRSVRWIGFLYTLFVIPWQMGLTLEEKVLWGDRLQILNSRLGSTLWTFFNNKPIQDPILFILSMSILYWLIAVTSSYMLVRYRRPWVPLGIAGISVLVIEYYHPFLSRASLLTAMLLFFGLMLVGRLHYLAKREDWENNHIALDAETGFDLSRGTIIAGLVLVIMAWNFPGMIKALTPGTEEQQWVSISWQGIRERLSNVVAGLQSPATLSVVDFGNVMGLGNGAALGDDINLIVTPMNLTSPPETRFYWRGRTYDYYSGGQWGNSIQSVRNVVANDKPFVYPPFGPGDQVQVNIKNVSTPAQTYYSPGLPISVDRAGKAQYQTVETTEVDVVSFVAAPVLNPGDAYNILSYVARPTAMQLRSTANEYPDWVKANYLQVPQNLPPEIGELAHQLTDSYDNPYDKVVAITSYLRKTIKYNTSVPQAPAGRDPIDWFLFEHKEGYCNYYATAEVLLLRSIGIPSRLAVGYAEGEALENGKFYVVRNRDSHAWPEVFFFGAGWVPFEPTVSQPEYALPSGVDEAAVNDTFLERGNRGMPDRQLEREPVERPQQEGAQPAAPKQTPFPTQWVLFSVLLLSIVMFFVYRSRQLSLGQWKPIPVVMERTMRRRGIQPPVWLRRWANFVELTPVERIFGGIPYMVRVLGGRVSSTQTPHEQMRLLTSLLPGSDPLAEVILEEYQRSTYSHHAVDQYLAKQANRQLWRQVFRTWVKKHIHIEIQVT